MRCVQLYDFDRKEGCEGWYVLLLDFDCISGEGIKIVQSWVFLSLSAVEWKLGALSIGCILH